MQGGKKYAAFLRTRRERASGARSGAQFFPRGETALSGLELGVAAAFLLHQIKLHTADRLDRGEDFFPRRDALAEEDAETFFLGARARRPVLEMNALDTAGVGLDPGDGIGAGLDAGTDVELEYKLLRRTGREQVHDASLTLDFFPLAGVIVKTGREAVLHEFRRGGGEIAGEFFPTLGTDSGAGGAREHEGFRAKNLVELDRAAHRLAGRERRETIVRRVAAQPEILELPANIFGERKRPPEIRRVELDALVAELGDGLERLGEILSEFATDGVELDADGIFFRIVRSLAVAKVAP